MSDQRSTVADVDQQYTEDARRRLRAYPPRWRRAREEEVLGVLLDTRPSGASRLDLRTRRDLLRGGLAFRLRSHPPLLAWLLYRLNGTRLPAGYAEWVRDDVQGRLYPLRTTAACWLVVLAGLGLLLHLVGGVGVPWWFVAVVVGGALAAAFGARGDSRARILQDALDAETAIARVDADRALRWDGRRRWSYGRWVAVPVVAGWLAMLALAVPTGLALAAVDRATVLGSLRGADASPVMPVWVAAWVLFGVTVLIVCRRRVATRPEQPWREGPVTPHPAVVVLLAVAAALVPLALLAGPLGLLLEDAAGSSAVLTVAALVVEAVSPASFGLGFLGTPLLVAVLVAPLVHLHIRGTLARHPVPAPALVDVVGLAGGRDVLVDPPVVPAKPIPWN